MDILVVVDMQNDFISGSLGTTDAENIVNRVKEKIESFEGRVIFTRDTHTKKYLDTREGLVLPVIHCIDGSKGWEIADELKEFVTEAPIDKPCFGSTKLGEVLAVEDKKEHIESITLIGLCTSICIISNAYVLQAFLPETTIIVDASCCAGSNKEAHETALKAMAGSQIEIIGE